MEILELILLFILAIPFSIVAAILIVLFWYLVGVGIVEAFIWIKRKIRLWNTYFTN